MTPIIFVRLKTGVGQILAIRHTFLAPTVNHKLVSVYDELEMTDNGPQKSASPFCRRYGMNLYVPVA